jgi:hypothetical protein
VADSMALGLGTKLGALVYASNSAPIRSSNWPFFSGLNTSTASVSSVIGTPLPPKIIKLLPEKITEKTTVYAYFPSSSEGRQLIDYRFAASESRRC